MPRRSWSRTWPEGRALRRKRGRHGEVACPGCGLPVDAQRDIVEELRTFASSEPVGAIVTHCRCVATFG